MRAVPMGCRGSRQSRECLFPQPRLRVIGCPSLKTVCRPADHRQGVAGRVGHERACPLNLDGGWRISVALLTAAIVGLPSSGCPLQPIGAVAFTANAANDRRCRRITATRRTIQRRASQTAGCPSIEFTTSARSSPVDAAVRRPKSPEEPRKRGATSSLAAPRGATLRPSGPRVRLLLRSSCDGRRCLDQTLPARDFAPRSRFGGSGLRSVRERFEQDFAERDEVGASFTVVRDGEPVSLSGSGWRRRGPTLAGGHAPGRLLNET